MSYSSQVKFWNNPELVDRLLNFLDASSTHQLALAHPFTISVLQTDQAWKKFLRRSCPSFQKEEEATWPETKSLLGLYGEKFKPILLVQDYARWCKMVQDGSRWCNMVQDSARWCKMVQDGAR